MERDSRMRFGWVHPPQLMVTTAVSRRSVAENTRGAGCISHLRERGAQEENFCQKLSRVCSEESTGIPRHDGIAAFHGGIVFPTALPCVARSNTSRTLVR